MRSSMWNPKFSLPCQQESVWGKIQSLR